MTARDRLQRAILPLVGAGATICSVYLLLSLTGAQVLELVAGVVLSALLLALPRESLPAIALVLFAAVPVAYMSVPQFFGRFLTPAVIALAVFAARQALFERKVRSGGWVALATVLALCLAVSSAMSTNPGRSWLWSLTVVICIVFLVVVAQGQLGVTVPRLYRTWEWTAIMLSIFAVAEFAFGSNPIAELYYSAQDLSSGVSNWTTYRVRTMLGHPLMNALFFGPTATLLLLRFFETGRKVPLIGGALSVAALVLTGSRGGLLALGAGVMIGLVALLVRTRAQLGRKLIAVVILPAVLIVAYFSPLIQDRLVTGQASAGQRFDVLQVAAALIARDGLGGYGPGTAQSELTRRGVDILLESSALQAILGLGLVTATALGLVLLLSVVGSFRRRHIAPAAAIIAYLVCASTFNIWDQYPGSMALVGLLILLGLGAEAQPPDRVDTAKTERNVVAELGTA